MIVCSHTIGEHVFKFRRPPTSGDVLDWLVWCQAARPDPKVFVDRALEWASQWLMFPSYTPQELEAELLAMGAAQSFEHLQDLCNAIAASAAVPAANLDDMRLLFDRKNDVPDDWKPRAICRCRKCVAGLDLKPGQKCKRDGLEPLSEVLMAYAMSVTDHSAPYYLEQIRSVVEGAESRRLRYEREKAEDEEETRRILSKSGPPSATRH